MKKITIELDPSFKFEGELVKELTMREPKVMDIEAMDNAGGGNITKVIMLAASLSDRPIELIREMNTEDFTKVAGAVSELMGKFQAPQI
jgi:hypothetical protein